MKIPNAERAIVDIRKLRGYCLNPQHVKGKHKAPPICFFARYESQ